MNAHCICNMIYRTIVDTANSIANLNTQTVCDSDGCYEPTNLNVNNGDSGSVPNGSGFKNLLVLLTVLFLIYAMLSVLGRNVKRNLPTKPARQQNIQREKDSAL